MIPLIPAAIFGGIGLVLLIGALILRRTRLVQGGIPLPAACLILGLMLAGGLVFVTLSNRVPEKPTPAQSSEPPPEMAAMVKGFSQIGMREGAPPPRDPKRPVVVLVQRLAVAVPQESFQLAARQRAEMKAKLSAAAAAEQMPPQHAVQLEESLRDLLTEEQRKQLEAIKLDRPDSPINYTADFAGNPFREGDPKEALQKILDVLAQDEP